MPSNDSPSTARPAALEARSVSVRFREAGRELPVLDGIDLRVAPGEFLALIGPSGCGKSTLLRVLAGLETPFAGEVRIDGRVEEARLGKVGFMPQRDGLLPWKSVLDNAAIGLIAAGVPARSARGKARAALAEFGLDRFAPYLPAQISGGMRQRVAFIRTILPGFRTLLLDEPLAALDALTRAEVQAWLADAWERLGLTVVLVTHDIDEALTLAGRVVAFTARPAGVSLEAGIDLPRPRSHDVITSPAFAVHKRRLLAALAGGRDGGRARREGGA
ncbi:MAG TPA: ABC transporter ATP-binding protein [Gemmatimonadota bacterium]|nr:ABC transporter ATP-binding protein [Gemmatimonadota bacterium]